MTNFIQVAPGFAVAPQLNAEDFAAAAAQGFRAIVNNRPDGEAADQMPGVEAEAAAEAAGLTYRAIPVSGGPNPMAIEAMAEALAEVDGPVLAFCRSGTRSITLWALAQAKTKARTPAELLTLAKEAGYDLGRLEPTLEQLAQG